jgi:aryl-phospho-beta-D-glucosidase BglC (GH1 family)
MKNRVVKLLGFFTLIIAIFSCSSDRDSTETPTVETKAITASETSVSIPEAGGTSTVKITMTGKEWVAVSSQDWCKISVTNSSSASQDVTITVPANPDLTAREATLTFVADGSSQKSVKITVSQAGRTTLYPSYNTNPIAADASGMSSDAITLASKIKLGWNIGNALEATGGETAWGNPKTTKALIDVVKANGFNAIRIPCSWNQYLENSANAQIKTEWLNRVKEVVKYCVDNDMYVILNIHWDGGWLENNCTEAKKVENNAKQKAFWEQIATNLRDFDEHLLFASANEPNVDDATQMAVLNSYHQTFIDAVRSTGGKNAYRNLIIQGPATDIEKTNKLMTTLPTDKLANRLMVEVHYYTPYQFCLMEKDADWGKMFYYWGAGFHSTTDTTHNATWGEEADVDKFFKSMKTQFVDKGIPVVLGEFGAIRRTSLTGDDLILHLNSRAHYLNYVVKQAKANGMLPFYWDAGGMGDKGSALFNRNNNSVFDSQALTALVNGLK